MDSRTTQLRRLQQETYDALIVGGGGGGAAAAAALAAQGARVALIERGDFAGGVSQQSSNLIWGGIKYLESWEFALVRRLCLSRNRLLAAYPSQVQAMPFLLTLEPGSRYTPVQLWLGAWLYWLLGNGATPPPRLWSSQDIAREEPVIRPSASRGGVEYWDAWLPDNDARFVFGFVRAALAQGAAVVNYVESLGGERTAAGWILRARDAVAGGELTLRSRLLINAAGPYADAHNRLTGQRTRHRHVLSKGVHLIVDRVTPHRRALVFFAADGRLFFAIPMGARTCVGTTDTPASSPQVQVTAADRQFILDNINPRLQLPQPLTLDAIIAERCGVRPLAIDKNESLSGGRNWLRLSRRHALDVNPAAGHITIFGGKLTDCLNIGQEISDQVTRLGIALPHARRRWYGEPAADVKADFLRQAAALPLRRYTAGAEPLAERWWRQYGTGALDLLAAVRRDRRQAEIVLPGVDYRRCEIDYMGRREMIVRLEDFLRRRTPIAQLLRWEELGAAPGLLEACRLLFGARAEERLHAYRQAQTTVALQPKAS